MNRSPRHTSTTQLRADHFDHLQASGLSEETIKSARIRSVGEAEARAHGYAEELTGILIPYPDTLITVGEKQVPYTRLRIDKERQRRPGQKYENPLSARIEQGLTFYPYVPAGVEPLRKDDTRVLFITEGEKKALKLTQEGFPAIGLPGVYMFVDPSSKRAPDSKPLHPVFKKWRWRGRTVLVCFDSDRVLKDSVAIAHERLCRALTMEGALVRVVTIPRLPGQEKTGVDDFLVTQGRAAFQPLVDQAEPWHPFSWLIDHLPHGLPTAALKVALEPARKTLAELTIRERLDLATRLRERFSELDEIDARRLLAVPETEAQEMPQLATNVTQPREVVAQAWLALLSAPAGERLFLYGRCPARLVLWTEPTGGGRWRLQPVDAPMLQALLLRAADWSRQTRDGVRPCGVPMFVAPDMLAMPHSRVRLLRGTTAIPVLHPDSSLFDEYGFDKASGLLRTASRGLEPGRMQVPDAPTRDDIAAALALLQEELLGDFPFAQPRDRCHALAALVLTTVRHLIDGPTPLHLIEAPSEGTGKTLLAEILWLLATGEEPAPTPLPVHEEETRKKLLSLLAEAPSLILLDNISRNIDSPSLASVLTTTLWKDRVLGQSTTLEAPNEAIWLATGNNPSVSREMSRRCVRIRLDALTERPWLRQGFRHANLRAWVLEHRARLVGALLTLARAWILAGRPAGRTVLGSYSSWSHVVGGILELAGVEGFLEQKDEEAEPVDPDEGEWQALVAAWGERHGDTSITARELTALAGELEVLEVDGSRVDRSARSRFTRALARRRDRVYGPWRLTIQRNRHTKQNVYALVRVT